MPVSTTIPRTWKLPLFWAVVDGSMAGNLTQEEPALLVGQFFEAAGTATENVPIPVGSPALGEELFGQGSMLDRMVKAFFKVNTTQLVYAIPVAEPGAGVAATGSIEISHVQSASGVLTIYIAGQKVEITVSSTFTEAQTATALKNAINLNPDLPVTADTGGSNGAIVDLTCRWIGATGNDITIIPNYRGTYGGEAFPQGMTVAISPMAGGAGEPDFTAAISAIQRRVFDYVALPYTDTGSMADWATEFGFSQSGRWSYTRQQYGFILGARRTGYADGIEWGLDQDAPVISTMAVENESPTPVWEWTSQYCGLAAVGFTDDPARPLQTLEFVGILPAPLEKRFTQGQLNNLTNCGWAIQDTAPDGNPMILREATQYQFNQYGQGDTAFSLLTVLATLAALLRRMRASITSKYPRVKLLPNGTKVGPGQAAVTPDDIKAEIVSEFVLAQWEGLVANTAMFIANLIVEMDTEDPNRVNVLWPPQLAGQLRQMDVLAQFRLLYPPVLPV